MNYDLPEVSITFDYSNYGSKISTIESLIGSSGYMSLTRCSVSALDTEDEILCSGYTESGDIIDPDTLRKLWRVPGEVMGNIVIGPDIRTKLSEISESLETGFIMNIDTRNSEFFDEEIAKLEKWTDDMKTSVEIELRRLDIDIATLKTQSRKLIKLEEKLEAQKTLKDLEKKRSDMRRNLYDIQDDIDKQKDTLLSGVEARLKRKIEKEEIMNIKFTII